jgi:hypothetical protein
MRLLRMYPGHTVRSTYCLVPNLQDVNGRSLAQSVNTSHIVISDYFSMSAIEGKKVLCDYSINDRGFIIFEISKSFL